MRRWHHFARMLVKLEEAQDERAWRRRLSGFVESVTLQEARLLPDTLARILARWAEAQEALDRQRGPRLIKPIPPRKVAAR